MNLHAQCDDPLACNYDENAEGDADCVFPAEFYDCDGCINDTDGDGVVDGADVGQLLIQWGECPTP